MSAAHYVMHDGARWRVREEYEEDGEQWYDLVQRRRPGQPGLKGLVARVADCQPDTHEPVRVWRDDDAVIRYYTKRGIVKVSVPRGRTRFMTTLKGILQMCAHAEAARKARDRAFKRMTGRRA